MTDFEQGRYVPISKVIETLIQIGSLNWHIKFTASVYLNLSLMPPTLNLCKSKFTNI